MSVPHASDAQRLLALHQRLEQALRDMDWQALAGIDEAIGDCLASLAEPDAQALAARERLRQLHREALAACAEECERLQRLLHDHLDNGEGRAAYQRIDLLHSGEQR